MKKRIEADKRIAFIPIPVPVSSAVMGSGLKTGYRGQGRDGGYVAPTPSPENASVGDVFDDKGPDAGNESFASHRTIKRPLIPPGDMLYLPSGITEQGLVLLCHITDKSTAGGGMTSNRLEHKTNIKRLNGWLI